MLYPAAARSPACRSRLLERRRRLLLAAWPRCSRRTTSCGRKQLGIGQPAAAPGAPRTGEPAPARAARHEGAAAGRPARIAEILYAARDPFSRRVIIDKGMPARHRRRPGGDRRRRRHRPGDARLPAHQRSDAAHRQGPGDAGAGAAQRPARGAVPAPAPASIELRFLAANADVQTGDMLVTSGLDGVYLPGLPVAKVVADRPRHCLSPSPASSASRSPASSATARCWCSARAKRCRRSRRGSRQHARQAGKGKRRKKDSDDDASPPTRSRRILLPVQQLVHLF